jgi:hypothetical protein
MAAIDPQIIAFATVAAVVTVFPERSRLSPALHH